LRYKIRVGVRIINLFVRMNENKNEENEFNYVEKRRAEFSSERKVCGGCKYNKIIVKIRAYHGGKYRRNKEK